MNSILTREPALAAFVKKLLQQPYFQDGTLTLYSDICVPCISYTPSFHRCGSNLCSEKERYRQICIDLLVCWDDGVLVAVCFDEGPSQHEAMFSTYLNGLKYLRCGLLDITDTHLADLYEQLTQELDFYTGYQLTNENYLLQPVPISEDLQTLQRKYFLRTDPLSLFYTRQSGLFYQCALAENGALVQTPVTSEAMREEFFCALRWQAPAQKHTEALLTALNMPLRSLFARGEPGALDLLEKTLAAVTRRVSPGSNVQSFTYADCLDALHHLDTACAASGVGAAEAERLCCHRNTIVYTLSILSESGVGLFTMPLRQYFEAAAAMTGCFYPIWLYRQQVRPHLCNQPEDTFCLVDLLYISQPHILFDNHTAPALSKILTVPLTFPDESNSLSFRATVIQ